MVHNPGWQVYRCWQDNSACFCVIWFSGGCAWGNVMCTSVGNQHHSCKTIQVSDWLCVRKTGHFVFRNAQTEGLPWLDSFLVPLHGSKSSFLNVSLCTASSTEKCWLAKKCHLNLTVFCRMWLKLSITLKYMALTYICSRNCVRWIHNTYVFSYTQIAF